MISPRQHDFHGTCAIEPRSLELIVGDTRRSEAIEARAAAPGDKERSLFAKVGRTAVIDIIGVMRKYASWTSWFFGDAITSDLSERVNAAAEDASIESILLRIDSPGGEVAGTGALAESVWRARQRKPVTAFISDLGASAAYWVASQASKIVASPGSLVGSIGTYSVVSDWSGFFERAGIKVRVIKAGEFKGAGTLGTEITEEQRAEFQRIIDAINREFLKAVSRGRELPGDLVRALANGRVHVASEAKRLNLIDEVGWFEDVIGEATARFRAEQVQAAQDKELRQRRAAIDKRNALAAGTTEDDAPDAVREKLAKARLALSR